MEINTKLFSLDDFINHEIPMLIKLHSSYSLVKKDMLSTKSNGILSVKNEIQLEQQLYFINANIDTIEVAMLMKESDVFEFHEYGAICLN